MRRLYLLLNLSRGESLRLLFNAMRHQFIPVASVSQLLLILMDAFMLFCSLAAWKNSNPRQNEARREKYHNRFSSGSVDTKQMIIDNCLPGVQCLTEC
jgi:hypothetical protein